MRDFPLVTMEFRRPSDLNEYFMFNFHLRDGDRTRAAGIALHDAENAMRAWCWEQFGAPADDPTDDSDPRWFCSEWYTFSFRRDEEAFAFRMRWM